MNNNKQVKGKKGIKRIVLIILGVFFLAIVVGIGFLSSAVSSINKEHEPNEIVLGNGEKTALLIYEPSSSDTAQEVTLWIAQIMANHGYTVTINLPSKELSYDWEEYDLIALGSPIYTGNVSPVLKEYVERNPVENKKILLYAMGLLPAEDNKEINEMNSWISASNNISKMKCKVDEREPFESFVEKTLTDWDE